MKRASFALGLLLALAGCGSGKPKELLMGDLEGQRFLSITLTASKDDFYFGYEEDKDGKGEFRFISTIKGKSAVRKMSREEFLSLYRMATTAIRQFRGSASEPTPEEMTGMPDGLRFYSTGCWVDLMCSRQDMERVPALKALRDAVLEFSSQGTLPPPVKDAAGTTDFFWGDPAAHNNLSIGFMTSNETLAVMHSRFRGKEEYAFYRDEKTKPLSREEFLRLYGMATTAVREFQGIPESDVSKPQGFGGMVSMQTDYLPALLLSLSSEDLNRNPAMKRFVEAMREVDSQKK